MVYITCYRQRPPIYLTLEIAGRYLPFGGNASEVVAVRPCNNLVRRRGSPEPCCGSRQSRDGQRITLHRAYAFVPAQSAY